MIRNYLTVAFRNLAKDGAYTAINIIGLTIGIACTLLITLYVSHEYSFDRYHEKSHRIYRLVRESVQSDGSTFSRGMTGPLIVEIADALPQVEKASRFYWATKTISAGDRAFIRRFTIVDPAYLDILTFTPIRGDLESLRTVPNAVAVTRTTAERLFETVDAIGRVLHADYKYFPGDYQVVAVIEDTPENTDFRTDILSTTIRSTAWVQEVWYKWRPQSQWRPVNGFLLLREDADPTELESDISALVSQRYGEAFAAQNRYHLQPLHSVHLRSSDYGLQGSGEIQYIHILIGAGAFVLLIACINYVNLATARSLKRSREVGLRKVLGAGRRQLVLQFLGESVFASCLATALAVFGLYVFGDRIQSTLGLSGSLANQQTHETALILAGVALLVGLGAGLYPSVVLSRLQPIGAIKPAAPRRSRLNLRSGLVITQFALSISLVTGTLVIKGQLDHMREHRLGFKTDQILVTRLLNSTPLRKRWREVKNRFTGHPGIVSISASSTDIGLWSQYGQIWVEGNEHRLRWLSVDHEFVDMFGLKLLSGRGFSSQVSSDSTHAFLLNETAVRALGWERQDIDPLGKPFEYVINSEIRLRGTVTGVVEDFHTESLHRPIEPTFLHMNPESFRSLAFKIEKTNVDATIAFMKETWEDLRQDEPFNATFLDESLESRYWREQQTAEAFVGVSAIAILIAALGLFGLVSYTTQQRTREIGVRKAIGASERGILALLGRESLSLIAMSNVLAIPVTYYLALAWLDSFAYRLSLGPGIFVSGVAIGVIIGAVAIGWQATRAARQDPVAALRQE